MVARTGLTIQQRVVLGIVRRYPSITPGRLARLLHLDAGTVSATIGRLEANRWVERRIHARDRRHVAIGLTEAGYALDVATVSPVERAIERALGRLDAADLAAFRRVLAVVTEELAQPDEAP
jgi:DNA-binding MarR family transcriptional regulator